MPVSMPRPQLPPDETDRSLGARLIRYRLAGNLTRKQVAKSLEPIAPIHPKAVQRWENEGRFPRDPRHYTEILRRLDDAGL